MVIRGSRRSWRAWLGRLGLVVASCAVTLGLLEVALYLVPAWSRATTRDERFAFSPYRPDGRLGFSLRPGVRVRHVDRDFSVTVAVNGFGMRGPERGASKPAGTARILLLGDSFAFGWGVDQEEAFGARLERLLTERVGPVEVLSAAVPGWSTDQHFVYLRTRGLALRPDLILLATSENDLTDLSLNRLTLADDRLPVRVEAMWRIIDATGRMRYLGAGRAALPRSPWPGETWLQDHSLLYHWLRFRLAKVSAAAAVRRARPAAPEWLARDPDLAIDRVSPDDLQRALAVSPGFRLRYHLFLVEAMEREARARGIPLRTFLVAHGGATRPADPVLAGLHAACAARGEACFDSARVISAAETAPFTFAHDSHWNREGHRRIGEALAGWLERDPALQVVRTSRPAGPGRTAHPRRRPDSGHDHCSSRPRSRTGRSCSRRRRR
jgi:lysophospholipase L1-like esterase